MAERDAATANGKPVQQRIHTLAGAGTGCSSCCGVSPTFVHGMSHGMVPTARVISCHHCAVLTTLQTASIGNVMVRSERLGLL